jgi:hypothetical protein
MNLGQIKIVAGLALVCGVFYLYIQLIEVIHGLFQVAS